MHATGLAFKVLPLLLMAALAGCGEDQSAQGPHTTTDQSAASNTAPPPVDTAPPTNGTPPATMTMPPANAQTPEGRSGVAGGAPAGNAPAEATGSVGTSTPGSAPR